MYTSFYGLKESPFNITPDSRFLFLSRQHEEALASLMYGIEQRKGFIVITGEIGAGKTTLCRTLLKKLDSEQIRIALVFNPLLTEIELLRAINQELGIECQYNSKKDLIDELNEFLLGEISRGHNVVVVIDEAQNLTPALLEQLRLLSNLETETEKLLQIVLIGQPELQDILELPQLQQLNQRVAVRYHLEPLSQEEIIKYIRHRLSVAGAEIDIQFTDDALDKIYEYSGGVPRKINVLCDRALLIGFVHSTHEIDRSIIEQSIEEVSGKKRDAVPGSKSRGILSPSRSATRAIPSIPAKTLYTAAGVIIIVLAGAFFLMDVQMRRSMKMYSEIRPGTNPAEPAAPAVPQGAVTPSPTPLSPTPTPAITETPGVVTAMGSEASPTPTPQPTPTPEKTKVYHYHWEYDGNGIVRVQSPGVSYQASVLNWLTLWGYHPDLSSFRQRSNEEIVSRDITGENNKLGLHKVELQLSFNEIINLDIPLILNINAAETDLSPWVVLKRVEGYSVTLLDPLEGLEITTRNNIESLFLGATGIYFDRLNLDETKPGESSQRVEKVQEFLIESGFLSGTPSGKFDSSTVRAIEKLQRHYNLSPTGRLTPVTVMLITSRLSPDRPRLFSIED